MLTHLVGFFGLVFFFFFPKSAGDAQDCSTSQEKKNVITLLNYFHKIILPGNGD